MSPFETNSKFEELTVNVKLSNGVSASVIVKAIPGVDPFSGTV